VSTAQRRTLTLRVACVPRVSRDHSPPGRGRVPGTRLATGTPNPPTAGRRPHERPLCGFSFERLALDARYSARMKDVPSTYTPRYYNTAWCYSTRWRPNEQDIAPEGLLARPSLRSLPACPLGDLDREARVRVDHHCQRRSSAPDGRPTFVLRTKDSRAPKCKCTGAIFTLALSGDS